MYDRAYHEANRERINQKHRENYLKHREERNARRRAEYQLQRERILQKQKEDRAPCPLCHLTNTLPCDIRRVKCSHSSACT